MFSSLSFSLCLARKVAKSACDALQEMNGCTESSYKCNLDLLERSQMNRGGACRRDVRCSARQMDAEFARGRCSRFLALHPRLAKKNTVAQHSTHTQTCGRARCSTWCADFPIGSPSWHRKKPAYTLWRKTARECGENFGPRTASCSFIAPQSQSVAWPPLRAEAWRECVKNHRFAWHPCMPDDEVVPKRSAPVGCPRTVRR